MNNFFNEQKFNEQMKKVQNFTNDHVEGLSKLIPDLFSRTALATTEAMQNYNNPANCINTYANCFKDNFNSFKNYMVDMQNSLEKNFFKSKESSSNEKN